MGLSVIMTRAHIAAVICVFALLVSACGGGERKAPSLLSFQGGTITGRAAVEVSLDETLAEIGALEAPVGVNAALFQQLKDELARHLRAKGVSKFASKPPTGEASRVNDLAITDNGDGTYALTWHYRSPGDYDQNGEVGIDDINPIATHFGVAWETGEENTLPAVVDGSGNYQVGIEDVTPLAMNFLTDCAGYRVQGADDIGGPWTTDGEVAFDEAEANGRLLFNVPYTAFAYTYYRVVPVDEAGAEGIESNTAGAPPVIVSVTPTEGFTGSDVAFSAVVAGAPPMSYAWNFGGGAAPNESAEEAPTVTLGAAGSYPASLTVTNDYGVGTFDFTLTVYPREWVHTWGGGSYDSADALCVEGDGNVYVAGYTYSFGAGRSDAFLLKYEASGALLWEKAWGGGDWDGALALCVDGGGNVYVAGYTLSFGAGRSDAFLLKYEASGALLWEKTWGGGGYDEAYALALDGDGSVYVVGVTRSFGAGSYDAFLLKYGADGSLQWEKTWGGGDGESANALCVDGDGNVYVAGYTHSFGAGGYDAFLLKYGAGGALQWKKTWGGGSDEYASTLCMEGDGNVYVAGLTYSFGAGNSDAFLLKYGAGGSLLWEKSWGGGEYDGADALSVEGGGNVYVAGYTHSFGAGSTDAFLLKYEAGGDLQWEKTWGGVSNDYAFALGVDGDGMIYLGGVARNLDGWWGCANGVDAAVSGAENSPVGDENNPVGTQGAPTGTVTEPAGVEDTGGGGNDALVMKIDPLLL